MMESYKALNKELVEENQTMRKTLAEYQTEIVHLRAKLMEVEINYNRIGIQGASLLKNFFTEQLKILDPQSSLLENNRRRSTLLAEEARRSSSVLQTPRSFNSTSPVRSSDVEEVMERSRNINDGNMRAIVEEQENDANLETEEESNNVMSHRDISEYMANMSLAYRTDTTEDTDADDENELSSARQTDTGQRTLRDVTNTHISTTNETATSPKCGEFVTVVRGGRCRANTATQNNIGNDSDVDEVRHLTRSGKVNSFSASFPLCKNSTENDQTASHSQDVSMETIENFHEGNSSTPNSKETTSRRPQRRCKPKSLKEISLQVKLRRT
ncbi:uncharacterized protein [Musca autumnalis]|uniref:uncharacterized protein n=1 Tax=Musca autumnalis TaxID=221902 RepID=UPI003CF35065